MVQAMRSRWPRAAELLEQAEHDILDYMAFPKEHWTRIYSTNPLQRLQEEVKRRTNVVGIFPNDAAVIRLVGAVLMEISDEWAIGRRYFSLETMRKLIHPEPLGDSRASTASSGAGPLNNTELYSHSSEARKSTPLDKTRTTEEHLITTPLSLETC